MSEPIIDRDLFRSIKKMSREELQGFLMHYAENLTKDNPTWSVIAMITINLYYTDTNGNAIDSHHASSMMAQITKLREKYNLYMNVERFISDTFGSDKQYIRKLYYD